MTAQEAWPAVVAGEDAAGFAYSVAGARVPTSDLRAARAGLDAHRANRDRAASLAAQAGGTLPTPAAAYELPFPVGSPGRARELLALVDNRLVALYAEAAEAASGPDRRWAARRAAECATRAVSWGAAPQAFPTGDVAGDPAG
ncbi:MAG: DUF4439 domain-containing protein [Candidatus Nanopelagicales bacterium]